MTKAILVGTVLVTNLLATSLGVYWLYESRQHYEQRAQALTENLAYSLDQSVGNIVDKVDLILQTTAEELERRAAAGARDIDGLGRFIDSHAAHLPELAAIAVVDQAGHLILSAGSVHAQYRDIKDEPYFIALRDRTVQGLFISNPVDNLLAQRKGLVFARRFDRPDGAMGGIVLSVLPLDYFVQLMANFNIGRKGTLSLRSLDGAVVARYPVVGPGLPGAIGSTPVNGLLRSAILSGQQEATYTSDNTSDGAVRTFTARRLDNAPLYAVAGTAREEYLAEWRAEIRRTVFFLVAFLLVSGVSAGFIYRLFTIAGEQSRRNRVFLERASDGVHVLDIDGNLVEASDSFCAMLGYRREELIGRHISLWDAKWSKSELMGNLVATVMEGGGPTTFETQHRRKDGTLIAVEVHAAAVQTRLDNYLYASSRDITERNRFKAEIDAALQRFEAIFQNNPVPLGMIDFSAGIYLDVNPAWENLSGYRRSEVVGRTTTDLPLFSQESDRKRFYDLANHVGSIGPFEAEFTHANGRTATCSVKGRTVAVGSRRLFIWAVEDVTERKAIEVGLRLAASVFEFSHDGIMVTDIDDRIIEINPAFTRITGYERDEVLGQSTTLLGADPDEEEKWAQVSQFLADTGGWRGETRHRRKSGEIYPVLLSYAAIFDDEGQIQRYIGVFSDISQIKEHEAELHKVAHFDALTDLPNRRLLADRMHQAIARTRRLDSTLGVCFVDLDGFKEVNDRLGHEVGDRLLIAVAEQIQEALRADDTLARLGGDEFVILLNDTGDEQKCFLVLDRVLAAIVKAAEITDATITLSGSIGVTLFPADDADADTLLRHADQAMYRAKESGKNRYHKFDSDHDRQLRASFDAQQRLAVALDREEFVLYYQPKVNMVSGAVIGTEALVRWLHPERGVVAPGAFLPTLEGSDLEVALGYYVIEAALSQLGRWKARGLTLPVSVNVSPNHLQAPGFVENLKEILARHPLISANDLELEIIESTAISDLKHATATLEACRAMGIRFALDDFGTGYSSLTYFRKLPIDFLKIDQSFVRDMLNHADDLGLVGSVVHLAEAFNRPVIAEGVETEQHGEVLVRLGCHLGQGYGIARPMPADLVEDWIKTWQGGAGWRFSAARRAAPRAR